METKRIISKKQKGELNPIIINHIHSNTISNLDDKQTIFEVFGFTLDYENNLELQIKKEFNCLKNAKKYFEKIIKKYPFSELILTQKTRTEILHYA